MSGAKTAVELVHGGWQDSPPDVADVVICDPPYTEHVHQGHALPVRDREAVSFDPAHPEDFVPELLARTRRWVVCFCAFEALGDYERIAGDAWVRSGIWLKVGPAPQMSGDRPGTPGEAIAIMHRPGRKRWNGGGKVALWEHPPARGAEKIHQTSKPVGLCVDLLRDFSDPGEFIWDPFAGCSPIGVASLKENRRYLGHELEERWATKGQDRLARRVRRLAQRQVEALPYGATPEEQAVLARIRRLLGRGAREGSVIRTLNNAGSPAPGVRGGRSRRWTVAKLRMVTRS